MSLEKLIAEAIKQNPLEVKEIFEEEMKTRMLASLEEKYKGAMKEENMYESFDLSEDTMHVDIDHMGGHDAMAKKHNISLSQHKHGTYAVGKKKDLQKYLTHHYNGDHSDAKENHPEVYRESYNNSMDEMDEKACIREMKKLHASACTKNEMYKKCNEKYGCTKEKFNELYAAYCSK